MEKAMIINNGTNQIVNLPEKYRLACDEVYVQKLGDAVILVPKESLWEVFMDGVNGFTDDFFASGCEPATIQISRSELHQL